MTISLNQQVDLLWKKVAYDVSKTDVNAIKGATNESIPSPPFLPGDNIWNSSEYIPSIIPTTNTDHVNVELINCSMDSTSSIYVTWKTNLTDWIPFSYGSTYQIKVFIAPLNAISSSVYPGAAGVTEIYAAGSGNNDEWYFDYQSGILNFIGTILPYGINFSTSSVWVSGARYVGGKGLTNITKLSVGDFTFSANTIQSSADIVFAAVGNISANNLEIINIGAPTTPTSAVNLSYLTTVMSGISANTIQQGNTYMAVNGNIGVISIGGTTIGVFNNTSAKFGALSLSGNSLSSSNDIILNPNTANVVSINATTALGLPTGTSTQRPSYPASGFLRYNSTIAQVEVFDGTQWASLQAQLSYQVFNGTGTTNNFSLIQPTSAAGIIVSINGVVQLPNIAYSVVNTTISFAEIPLAADQIDIRYLTSTVAPSTDLPYQIYINPVPIIVGTTSTIIDTFTVMSIAAAKYMILAETSDGNAHSVELALVQNGITANYTTYGVSSTSVFPLTFSASISSGICALSCTSNAPSTVVKVQTFYTNK